MTTTEPTVASNSAQRDVEQPGLPWWRYGMMWMVVGGPAAVVVAGLITVWIAAHNADQVVDPDYYQTGLNINKTLAEQRNSKDFLPAAQGRNHAATPEDRLPPP